MAKLLCINAVSKRKTNNLGDVVAIFSDSHVFSPAETAAFDVVSLPAFTTKQVSEARKTLQPDMSAKIVNEDATTDKTYLNVQRPKYHFRVANPLGATVADVFATNWDADKPEAGLNP